MDRSAYSELIDQIARYNTRCITVKCVKLNHEESLNMPTFNYDDIVKATHTAPTSARPSRKAWIVGIFEIRHGDFLKRFPDGVVYTIEFEDGTSTEVEEIHLEHYDR